MMIVFTLWALGIPAGLCFAGYCLIRACRELRKLREIRGSP
jgi:hypothetical protein